MSMATRAPTSAPRTEWLDHARGIAILGVMLVHTTQFVVFTFPFTTPQVWRNVRTVAEQGMYGVELFFFISGWLLAALYSRQLQPRTYAIRRLARIWPLWLAFSGLALGQHLLWEYGPWHDAVTDSDRSGWWVLLLTVTMLSWTAESVWNTSVPGGWSIQA